MSIGSITSTSPLSTASAVQRSQGMSVGGQTFSDEQIKQFIQANQGNPQTLAQQASSMGLNADQIQQALSVGGIDIEVNDISNLAAQYGYDLNAKDHSQIVAPQTTSVVDKNTSAWSPTQNRWITPTEVKAFINTNPSDAQIFQQASKLGLSCRDLNTMLWGQGYTGQALGQHYSRLSSNLFLGGLGYSTVDGLDGKIVAGGGHTSVDDPGTGGSHWVAGAPSAKVIGSSGLVDAAGFNGTTNWSVKDGFIGVGTGVAGDSFATTPSTSGAKSTIQTASFASAQSAMNSPAGNGTSSVVIQTAFSYGAAATKTAIGNLLTTEA